MRSITNAVLALSGAVLIAGQAMAAPSLGVNFLGRDSNATRLNKGETAGVEAQGNWNNLPSEEANGFDGTSFGLQASDGTYTAVTFNFAANDAWRSDGPTATPNDRLMKGIQKANPDPDTAPTGGTETMTFTFNGLPASSTYDVLVYGTHNGAGAKANIAAGGVTYYILEQASFGGTFLQGTATSDATRPTTAENYVRIANVSATASGTLVVTATKQIDDPQVADGIGVAAVQLVKTGGGALPINAVAPLVTTQPVAVDLTEYNTASFSVGVNGYWDIQWQLSQDDGGIWTDIPGATNPSYTTPLLMNATDDGNWYRAVVSNNIGSVTSDPAAVTVAVNTTAPQVTTQPNDYAVIVGGTASFTVAINGNYPIQWQVSTDDGANWTDIANATGLTYTTPALTTAEDGNLYHAVVSNNVGSVTSRDALLGVDVDAGLVQTQGIVRMVQYSDLANVDNTPFGDLYPTTKWQSGTFDQELFNGGVDVAATAPAQDNFGRVLEFVYRPPTTGQVQFYVRSDDGSDVFVSTDATPPTDLLNLFPDATEEDCCQPFQEGDAAVNPGTKPGYDTWTSSTESLPISVSANADRGVTFVYKEGTGGDWAQLAVRYVGDPTPAADLRPISPEHIWGQANPAGHRASISQQPADTTVTEYETATLTVAVTTAPAGDPVAYQWYKKAPGSSALQLIPGGVGATYITPQLLLEDDGTVYVAKVYSVRGTFLSEEATLTVNPDTTAPTIVSAGLIPGSTYVGVKFSKRMDATTLAVAANYSVNGATPTAALVVGRENKIVQLTMANAVNTASVQVANVTDIGGLPLETATVEAYLSDMINGDLYRAASNPLKPGLAFCFGEGGYFVAGHGADIWDNSDGGHYLYKDFTGAFDMRANVRSLDGSQQWAKCVLMARETVSTDPAVFDGSRHADVVATRSDTGGQNQISFQWRDTTDGGSGSLDDGDRINLANNANYPKCWIRLVRELDTSNLIKAYWSNDGVTWTKFVADHEIPTDPEGVLPATLKVGIAVTSHDNADAAPLATAVVESFSVVEFTGEVDPPLIDLPMVADGNITITWTNGGELQYADPADLNTWTGTGDTDGSYEEAVDTAVNRLYRVVR